VITNEISPSSPLSILHFQISPLFTHRILPSLRVLLLLGVGLRTGGGGAACAGEGPGGEAGDAEDEADGGQGQAEGAGEAQDPAGAAAGVEDKDAGAAGGAAEATQRGQEGEKQETEYNTRCTKYMTGGQTSEGDMCKLLVNTLFTLWA